MLSEKCGKFFFFYASHDRNIRRRHFDCATAGNTDDWRRPSAAVGRVTRRPSRRSTTETPPESHPPHSIGHRATVFPCPTRGRNTSPSRFTADWCAPLKIAHASRSAFDPTQFGTSVHVGGVGFFFFLSFFHFDLPIPVFILFCSHLSLSFSVRPPHTRENEPVPFDRVQTVGTQPGTYATAFSPSHFDP